MAHVNDNVCQRFQQVVPLPRQQITFFLLRFTSAVIKMQNSYQPLKKQLHQHLQKQFPKCQII